MDGVRAMFRAAIQRAIHDACGAVVVARSGVQQKQIAVEAWKFLYSNEDQFARERALVCGLAEVDQDFLERRMKLAAIPRPTEETLANAWTELELAYWRLGGEKGEPPEPRPMNSRGSRKLSQTNASRRASGHRISIRRLTGNAPQGRTLLFASRVPPRPIWPTTKPGHMQLMQFELPYGPDDQPALDVDGFFTRENERKRQRVSTPQ